MSELTSSPPISRRRRSVAVVVVALLALAAALVGSVTGSNAGAATGGRPSRRRPGGRVARRPGHARGVRPRCAAVTRRRATPSRQRLALAAAGVGYDAFTRTMSWLAADVDAVTGTGADTSPGQIGYLLVVIDAAGADATDFGGVDLVARLASHARRLRAGALRRRQIRPTTACSARAWRSSGSRPCGETPPPAAIDWLNGPAVRHLGSDHPWRVGGLSPPRRRRAPPAAPSASPASTRTARPSPRPRWPRSVVRPSSTRCRGSMPCRTARAAGGTCRDSTTTRTPTPS